MTCQNDTVVLPVSIGFALMVCMVFVSSCSTDVGGSSLSDRLPKNEAWQVRDLETSVGVLRGAQRAGEGDGVILYIEGDGRAYLSNGVVSGDPTPGKPVALDLAKTDTSGGTVMYVARPCQYVGPPMPKDCLRRDLYTVERWSSPVVEAYVALVAKEAAGQPVTLVGFSGGAYIALAVASRLPQGQVRGVRTYAGNLLPNHTQAHHRAERLEVAAVDWAKLSAIPMVHYIGRDDKVIPGSMKDAVLAEAGVALPAWRWVVVEASHIDGWSNLKD